MKKISKFIMSIFLLLFTIVGNFYFSSSQIKVAAISPAKSGVTAYKYEAPASTKGGRAIVNRITVTAKGRIDITYSHGFTEIMIVISKCARYKNDDNCDAFDTNKGNQYIIHIGGDYNKNEEGKTPTITKTLHLFDYFEYDEILQIEFIGKFINTAKNGDSGPYKYLFYDTDSVACNVNTGNCVPPSATENDSLLNAYSRIGRYLCQTTGDPSQNQEKLKAYNECFAPKMKNIKKVSGNRVYLGDVKETEYPRGSISNEVLKNSGDTNQGKVYIKVDNSKVEGASRDIDKIIYDTIIPAMIIGLFVAAGVSIAILGYKIVKSSDEPQERQDNIKKLRNILIGIALALIVLFALEPVVNLIEEYIEEK